MNCLISFIFLGPLSTVSKAPVDMPVAFSMLEKICLEDKYSQGSATLFGGRYIEWHNSITTLKELIISSQIFMEISASVLIEQS